MNKTALAVQCLQVYRQLLTYAEAEKYADSMLVLQNKLVTYKGALPNHFGKINVIMTLGGRGVRAVKFSSYTSLNTWFLSRFLMLL